MGMLYLMSSTSKLVVSIIRYDLSNFNLLSDDTSCLETTGTTSGGGATTSKGTTPICDSTSTHSVARNAIIGGVVGGVACVAAIVLIILWWRRRRYQQLLKVHPMVDTRENDRPILSKKGASRHWSRLLSPVLMNT